MWLRNIAHLYLIQVLRLLVPLIQLPFLARVLDAEHFGIYMYFISSALWLSLIIEYGFNISATRSLARSSSAQADLAIVEGTQSAKLILALGSIPFFVVATFAVKAFETHRLAALASWLLGTLIAFSPTFYFQAKERLAQVALVEGSIAVATLALIVSLVAGDQQFSLLLVIVLAVRLAGLSWLWMHLHRLLAAGRDHLDMRGGLAALRSGFPLFVFQLSSSLYGTFNVILLGAFVAAPAVGAYAAADRMTRIPLSFVAQASNAVFPRANALRDHEDGRLARFRRHALIAFSLLGLAIFVMARLASPYVIPLLFGDKAVHIGCLFDITAAAIPAISLSTVLAYCYLMPDGRESVLNRIIIAAGAINVPLAVVAIRVGGPDALAWLWVVAEWAITAVLGLVVVTPIKRRAGRA